ncbi:Ig-like domain-containing protein [Lysinibacillus sp. NPDC097162]|uniref:Ig-like domain-containing protein n=1 Tax=Lysinibacillus sp. NPDC097162 TaxID=3364140 RepID=UPI003811DB84
MINLFKKGFIYLTLMVLVLVSVNVESALATEVVDYEEGVTNLNNTPENSAVVGDVLKSPEIGWKRYDDNHKKLIYEKGKWVRYTTNAAPADYKKGSMGAKKNVTAKLEFWFLGSKINIITNREPTYTKNALVKIDGIDQGNLMSNGTAQAQTLAFKKEGLAFGIHKVEVLITNTPSNVNTYNLRIDAIDIDSDGSLVDEGFIENSITLDKNNLELLEGDSEKLTATVIPDGTNVIWTSSDESIATVDLDGNVTAIKEGIITVTAQLANTNLTANCIVTVKKQGSLETESITLDRNALELLEGSKDKLTATVSPDTAKVIWTSSDDSIATVDQDGNVTAIREGTAIITAKIENTEIAASSTVIVKKPINETSSAILSITLVNGITKEYDVTNTVLNNYLNWFESAQGTSTFKFIKTISPYKKVTEYIVHDKIASFEVREY